MDAVIQNFQKINKNILSVGFRSGFSKSLKSHQMKGFKSVQTVVHLIGDIFHFGRPTTMICSSLVRHNIKKKWPSNEYFFVLNVIIFINQREH